jgi:hypothetical protein
VTDVSWLLLFPEGFTDTYGRERLERVLHTGRESVTNEWYLPSVPGDDD